MLWGWGKHLLVPDRLERGYFRSSVLILARGGDRGLGLSKYFLTVKQAAGAWGGCQYLPWRKSQPQEDGRSSPLLRTTPLLSSPLLGAVWQLPAAPSLRPDLFAWSELQRRALSLFPRQCQPLPASPFPPPSGCWSRDGALGEWDVAWEGAWGSLEAGRLSWV